MSKQDGRVSFADWNATKKRIIFAPNLHQIEFQDKKKTSKTACFRGFLIIAVRLKLSL